MHVECIHEVMLLSVIVWVCMHRGVLANFVACFVALLLSSLTLPYPPTPSFHLLPSSCSQVWPEGSPSILTGVSKEVSVAIVLYTPSLAKQRCCTEEPAACLCFILFCTCEHPTNPQPRHLSTNAPSLHPWP